jgi:hypothetical protein
LLLLTYWTTSNACHAIHASQLLCLKTFANIPTFAKMYTFAKLSKFCGNINFCKKYQILQKVSNAEKRLIVL